ncbi:MAG: PspC domain-containing protein [Flavobacteriales bacterium]|nr:PspC domain-containing protein [Flavobacteriales bacterium]
MSTKKLLRKEGKILGVCAGLADYLDVDVTIIRIAFVFGVLFAGVGLIPYLILALIMPKG